MKDTSNQVKRSFKGFVGPERYYYRLGHELLKSSKISQLAFNVLQYIQTIQIIHLVNSLNDSSVLRLVDYISLDYLIQSNHNIYLSIVLASIFLLVIIIISLLLIAYGLQNSSSSQIVKIIIPLMSFIMICFRSILVIPYISIIGISLSPIIHTNYNLSEASYGLGVICLILFVILSLFINISLIEPNPFSQAIFSGQSQTKMLVNIGYKLIMCSSSIINPNKEYKIIFFIFFVISTLIRIIYLHLEAGLSKQSLRNLQIKHCYFIFWFALYGLFIHIFKMQKTTFIHVPVIFVISLMTQNYIQTLIFASILQGKSIYMRSDTQIWNHALALTRLVDTIQKRQSRIQMKGYVRYHHRICRKSDCNCQNALALKKKPRDQQKNELFKLIVNLINETLTRLPNSKKLHLLVSFLYQYRQKNRFRAIYSLVNILKDSSLVNRLYFYHQIHLIENQMIVDDEKQHQNKSLDINGFLDFNNKIVQFEDLIEKCVRDYIQFWNQLLQPSIDIKRLQEYGAIVTTKKDLISNKFTELNKINPNNAHILFIYGYFLSEVISDQTYYIKFIEKAHNILINLKDSTKIDETGNKYTENAETSIIIISGNKSDLGIMVHSNNFVQKFLGYKRAEVVDHNVNIIMPKIFGEHHNEVLSRYLSTSAERFNGKQRLVPVLAKDGFMIPCIALTKPIPSLKSGIQIAGFISKIEQKIDQDQILRKYSYILYRADTQVVMGISKSCYIDYGIPNCLIYGHSNNTMNELKLINLFGISLEKQQSVNSSISNAASVVLTLKTTHLKQQFIFSNNSEEEGQKSKNPNGFQAQVVIKPLLSLVYNKIPLKIISFYNVDHVQQELQNRVLSFRQQNEQKNKNQKLQNDDFKDLKDFKNFISIKSQPLAIRAIKYLCSFLIILCMLSLAGILFIIISISTINHNSATTTQLGLINQIAIPQILYLNQIISLNRYSFNQTQPNILQNKTLKQVSTILEQVKINQDTYLSAVSAIPYSSDDTLETYTVTSSTILINLKQTNEILSQQLSKFQTIFDSSPAQFNITKTTTWKYMIQSRHDIILSLIPRLGQNRNKIRFTLQHQRNIRAYFIYLCSGMMIIGFVIWLIMSASYALSVQKINNRVLSLFSLIPPNQVSTVVRKSYQYMRKNLSQAVSDDFVDEIKDYNDGQKNDGQMLQKSFGNGGDHETSNIGLNKAKMTKQSLQVEKKFAKMINSENTEKTKILIQYIALAIFMAGFVIGIHFFMMQKISVISKQLEIYDKIGSRIVLMENLKVLMTQYVLANNFTTSGPTIKQRTLDMIDNVYTLQRSLLSYQFSSSYKQVLRRYNNDNVCQDIQKLSKFQIITEPISFAQCISISKGILSKGVKTTIVTILQDTRNMLSEQLNLSVMMENIKELNNLLKYINLALMSILQMIKLEIRNIQQSYTTIFLAISGVLISVMVLFWRIIWIKYIEQLNEQIWRTKGMLNIIPMRIIANNDLLKKQFTSGILQQAVR